MVATAGFLISISRTCSLPMILSQLGVEMAAHAVGDSSRKRNASGDAAPGLPIHQAEATDRHGTPWMVPDTLLGPASAVMPPLPLQAASRTSAQAALMARPSSR